MKNDTQTHAANLADNATAQHTNSGEANARLIVESVNSAPRLKRERDELLAAAQHLLLSINDEPALRRLIADSCPQASENLYNAIARIEKGGAS